jgi:hypothetical protein
VRLGHSIGARRWDAGAPAGRKARFQHIILSAKSVVDEAAHTIFQFDLAVSSAGSLPTPQ